MSKQTLYQWLTSFLRNEGVGKLEKDISKKQLRKLAFSGLLTDLFSVDETKINKISRTAFRRVLNLEPVPSATTT